MRGRRLAPALAALALTAAGAAPVSGAGAGETPSVPVETYDVLLRGGRIVDGSGNPWFAGDVAIRGEWAGCT